MWPAAWRARKRRCACRTACARAPTTTSPSRQPTRSSSSGRISPSCSSPSCRRWSPSASSWAAAKGRSTLTILGVVIGVSTVMAMAAIVSGVRDQIVHTVEVAGPTTFYVVKVFSTTPLNPQNLPKWVRVRPDLTEAEAERMQMLPEISYASLWAQLLNRIDFGGTRTNLGLIWGADERYPEIYGGELAAGRWFARMEVERGTPVVVLSTGVATTLFGNIQPIDKLVHVGGRPARVIGVYQSEKNIFEPPGQQTHAIIPYKM